MFQHVLMFLTFALSGPFLLWSAVSMLALGYRCYQTLPQYKFWNSLPEQQHSTLVMLPGMVFFLEWADYQRFKLVWNILIGRWPPIPDWDVTAQLVVGTVASGAIMWSTLCILLGERVGQTLWNKMVLLGGIFGAVLAVICVTCGVAY